MVFKGTRASFSIPARRPRWEGEDTSVLKAVWRSWDAVDRCQTQEHCTDGSREHTRDAGLHGRSLRTLF
jgi:hypothetical protein